MLTKKKNRNVWVYRTMVNGKTWERSTGETDRRKAQAKVPEMERLAELLRKRPVSSLDLEKAIIAEVDRVESDVSERQAERVDNALTNLLLWCRKRFNRDDISLEKIDTDLLEEYQRHRLKEAAKDTVNKELCYAVRMLRNNKFMVVKPKAKKGEETEVREFTDEELEKFFQNCPEHERAMFLVMLATGARPAEVVPSAPGRSTHVALLKSDVDPKAGTVRVRSAKLEKGQKAIPRLVHVNAEVMAELEDAMKRNPGDHVFPPHWQLARNFKRIIARAGIARFDPLGRKLTAHSFRHTYATKMAEAVEDNQFLLSRILGHKQIATTNRYVHAKVKGMQIETGKFTRKSPQADPSLCQVWGTPMGNEEKNCCLVGVVSPVK